MRLGSPSLRQDRCRAGRLEGASRPTKRQVTRPREAVGVHTADLPEGRLGPIERLDENNRPNLFEHRCQRKCPMIKEFGRLFCAYTVQSVHVPLNLLIRFQLAPRGHHDWPYKRVFRQSGADRSTLRDKARLTYPNAVSGQRTRRRPKVQLQHIATQASKADRSDQAGLKARFPILCMVPPVPL